MRYMQIRKKQKLHLVYEPGEGVNKEHLIEAGYIGAPICGRGFDKATGGFKMTINVPLANACRNCLRVMEARDAR
jgi:hypothetical protein